jgi:hypothetical protein
MEENKIVPVVEESAEYENCLGVRVEEDAPQNLFELVGIEDESPETEDDEWKKHWVGMPEFTQEKNLPFKTLYLHFRNAEDYEEFAKLIDQSLTKKTKSIWYPKLDRNENTLLRWIEQND